MLCSNKHYYSGDYCHICETKPEKKKPKPIRKVSVKLKAKKSEYEHIKASYLHHLYICEVEDCDNRATTIHHIKGRDGDLLTDPNNFLACCMTCHRYIEDNPLWAKEHGYSESRI